MKSANTRYIVQCGLIAAIYAALTLTLAPFSFGAIQVRVAEALTILPLFTSSAIPGVTIGCVIANAAGVAMGANILGVLDVFTGSAATLTAALLTYWLRNKRTFKLPLLAVIPPVIVNGIVIGLELTYVMADGFEAGIFLVNFLQVSLGQFISCGILGLSLFKILEKNELHNKIFFK